MFNLTNKTIPQISPEDLKKAMDIGIKFTLLDVRTPGEYARSKLAGSINLPVDEISGKINSVIPDKSSLVYVYCLSGSRSSIAVENMLKMGYTNVFDLPHGLLAWRIKGFPEES